MLKILISFFLSIAFVLTQKIQAAEFSPIPCAPQLQRCLSKMQKLEEIQELIAAIQKEGPICLFLSNHELSQQFGAFWDPDRRTIFVNLAAHGSEGEMIGSILFELHNASINSKLNRLDNLASTRKINKAAYVQGVERLEYQNSVNASKIAQKGIQLGLFPPSAFLHTYNTFEEHFRIQQEAGHSAWIARTYDSLVN
jgi:hypothetical protein